MSEERMLSVSGAVEFSRLPGSPSYGHPAGAVHLLLRGIFDAEQIHHKDPRYAVLRGIDGARVGPPTLLTEEAFVRLFSDPVSVAAVGLLRQFGPATVQFLVLYAQHLGA